MQLESFIYDSHDDINIIGIARIFDDRGSKTVYGIGTDDFNPKLAALASHVYQFRPSGIRPAEKQTRKKEQISVSNAIKKNHNRGNR